MMIVTKGLIVNSKYVVQKRDMVTGLVIVGEMDTLDLSVNPVPGLMEYIVVLFVEDMVHALPLLWDPDQKNHSVI